MQVAFSRAADARNAANGPDPIAKTPRFKAKIKNERGAHAWIVEHRTWLYAHNTNSPMIKIPLIARREERMREAPVRGLGNIGGGYTRRIS